MLEKTYLKPTRPLYCTADCSMFQLKGLHTFGCSMLATMGTVYAKSRKQILPDRATCEGGEKASLLRCWSKHVVANGLIVGLSALFAGGTHFRRARMPRSSSFNVCVKP